MYPGALVSSFVNIAVYFNKLANNFSIHSIGFFKKIKNLEVYRLFILPLSLRFLIYCKAVK